MSAASSVANAARGLGCRDRLLCICGPTGRGRGRSAHGHPGASPDGTLCSGATVPARATLTQDKGCPGPAVEGSFPTWRDS